jgi:hypothetical protein
MPTIWARSVYLGVDEQILGLEVAVQRVHRVHVLERLHDARRVELGRLLVERGARAQNGELAAEGGDVTKNMARRAARHKKQTGKNTSEQCANASSQPGTAKTSNATE